MNLGSAKILLVVVAFLASLAFVVPARAAGSGMCDVYCTGATPPDSGACGAGFCESSQCSPGSSGNDPACICMSGPCCPAGQTWDTVSGTCVSSSCYQVNEQGCYLPDGVTCSDDPSKILNYYSTSCVPSSPASCFNYPTNTCPASVITACTPVASSFCTTPNTMTCTPSTLSFSMGQGGALPAAQTYQVAPSSAFQWAVSSYNNTAISTTPALSVIQTGTQTVSVSVKSGLAQGNYTTTINNLQNGGGASCSVGVNVTVNPTTGRCGNGFLEPPEQCDAGGQNGVVCSPTYGSTCTYCSTTCQSVTLQGGYCGDHIVNGPEQCDGSVPSGVTCQTQGFANGIVSCTGSCLLDTSGCIKGNHDGNDCNSIWGWTCDPANYASALQVNIYADGVAPGNLIGTVTANGVRNDVASLCGNNANHGFSLATPATLKNGVSHQIYAYGQKINTNTYPLLSTPRTLTCDITPPTVGVAGAPATCTNQNQAATINCNDGPTGSGCNTNSISYFLSPNQIASCPAGPSGYTTGTTASVTDHYWVCGYACDIAGNCAVSVPVEFKVDHVIDSVTASTVPNQATINAGTSVTINGAATDNNCGLSNMIVTFDGAAINSCSFASAASGSCSASAGSPALGVHNYSVTAYDSANPLQNQRTASGSFTVIDTPLVTASSSPTSPLPNPNTQQVIVTAAITPKGTATMQQSNVNIYVDGIVHAPASCSPVSVAAPGTMTCTYSSTYGYTPAPHTYYATARDSLNQLGTSPTGTFYTNNRPTAQAMNASGTCYNGQTITLNCLAQDVDQPDNTLAVRGWAGQCTTGNCFATRSWSTGPGTIYFNNSLMTAPAIADGQPFTFTFTINQPVGTSIAATCGVTDERGESAGVGQGDAYPVCLVQCPASIGSFTATPSTVTLGSSSTLAWTTSGTTSVTIDGVGTVPANGNTPVTPTGTTTYNLTANALGCSQASSITVNIAPPSITSFTATPNAFTGSGISNLAWTTTGATSASINNGVGNVLVNGNTNVNVAATTTYTLTATGPGGTTTASVTVTINPVGAPTITFTATSPIVLGGSSTLSWSTTNANTVSINQGIGSVALSGTRPVSPAATTTYTLTATGPGGTSTATATVSISPPTATLTASPTSITLGSSSTLTWTTTGATSASIDGGVGNVATSGSLPVSPGGTTAYNLTATGPGGSVIASAIVDVNGVCSIPTFSNIVATPALANATNVIIGFASNMALDRNPQVNVTIYNGMGSPIEYKSTFVSKNVNSYVYNFTVSGAMFSGPAQIKITGNATGCSISGQALGGFDIDISPPSTGMSCNGAPCRGVYNPATTVNLSCVDRPPPPSTAAINAGCDDITYSVDGAPYQSVESSTVNFPVNGYGTHTVRFYSNDTFNNVEGLQTRTFTIYDSSNVSAKLSVGLSLASPSFGQITKGSLSGTVVDGTGTWIDDLTSANSLVTSLNITTTNRGLVDFLQDNGLNPFTFTQQNYSAAFKNWKFDISTVRYQSTVQACVKYLPAGLDKCATNVYSVQNAPVIGVTMNFPDLNVIVPATPAGDPNFTKPMQIRFTAQGLIQNTNTPCSDVNCNATYVISTANGPVSGTMSYSSFDQNFIGVQPSVLLDCDSTMSVTVTLTDTGSGAAGVTQKNFFLYCSPTVTVVPNEQRFAIGEKNKDAFTITIWNPGSTKDFDLEVMPKRAQDLFALAFIGFKGTPNNDDDIIFKDTVNGLSSKSYTVMLNYVGAGRAGSFPLVIDAKDVTLNSPTNGVEYFAYASLMIFADSLPEFSPAYIVILFGLAGFLFYRYGDEIGIRSKDRKYPRK